MTDYAIYSILVTEPAPRKPLFWMGSSLEDLREFPAEVRHDVGAALRIAQAGGKSPDAKPLKGFGGGSVLEIVSNHDGNAFRAIYALSFRGAVYVLHIFQKKSKRGIHSPKKEIDLVRQRLRVAQGHHSMWSENNAKENK